MRHLRLAATLAALASALTLTACGGGGERSPDVSLLVTSDFGARVIDEASAAPVSGSPTLLAYLKATADPDTSAAIERDPAAWSLYVNGLRTTKDPAKEQVHGGDRVWWDRHSDAIDPRAVIGSYPEPFLHGIGGKRWPTRVECVQDGDKTPCDAIAERLGETGVIAGQALTGTEGGGENLRVLVGPWASLRTDRAARLIAEGPRASGVFARFTPDGRRLELLDARGHVVQTAGAGAGLIAATRYEEEPPTWFVTGTDAAGVAAAVQAFDEGTLGNRFALAVVDDRGRPVPSAPVG
jgi:hypothetical protein